MTSVLEAKDISIRRGDRLTLSRASLSLDRATLTTLRGPSGGGKTTLIRALAGLDAVDAGAIFLDERNVLSIPPQELRRSVAYVSQRPAMLPGSVLDNVRAGPALVGEHLSEAEITTLLERVGLSAAVGGRLAETLSGGEQQRVALARALANRPSVLLLDEPTAALDAASSHHVLAQLRGLADDGMAVLLITHTTDAAFEDAAYRCADGRLERLA